MYIVYDLDTCLKILLRNFTIRNCLFDATTIVKNSEEEKYVYRYYGIAFDGKGEQSFDNNTARNAVVFGVDNSLSSHADTLQNSFLVLDEEDNFGINRSFGAT